MSRLLTQEVGGVVRYTKQMALTGNGPRDALAKTRPLGHVLRRTVAWSRMMGVGDFRTDSPSVHRRQGHMCRPFLLSRAMEVVEGERRKGAGGVLRCDGKNRHHSNGIIKSFWTK